MPYTDRLRTFAKQQSVLKTWTPDAVQNAKDPAKAFAEYAQQSLGVPWPSYKDLILLRKKANEFFGHYPDADWRTLCRVVSWAANRKRRYARVWALVDDFRKAYRDGALPELDPGVVRHSQSVQEMVDQALSAETDDVWRTRLLLANGRMQQEEVLASWRRERQP
jgi:hypothetical protein